MKNTYLALVMLLLASVVFSLVLVMTKDLPLSSSIGSTSFVVALCFKSMRRRAKRGDSDDWQHFYSIFASYLEIKNSPERAFEAAAQECRETGISTIIEGVSLRMMGGASLPDCLMAVKYQDQSSAKLAFLAASALRNDSTGASEVIMMFIKLLRRNTILSRERESVLREGKFKAFILSVTNSISIAILAGIFPILQGFVMGSDLTLGLNTTAPFNYLWMAFFTATLSSSLLLSRGFRLQPINAMIGCSALVYVGTYLFLRMIF